MANKTTYTKITAKIILITLLFTLSSAFIYGEYLKKNAMFSLAQVDAKKTSLLIFETLYSAMQKGWKRDEVNLIIKRLNSVDPNMTINIYRSDLVVKLYEKRENQRPLNDSVERALAGEEVLNITDTSYIDYYYPITAKNNCLKCHKNAKLGDVLGVIDVSYPVNDLKVSFDTMINFFIIFILLFSIVIFLIIFIKFNQYLIQPIKIFSNVITNITNSRDMTKRIEINDNIEELDSIKSIFNVMLDSIEYQFYYDNLTGLENRRKLTEKLEKRKESFLIIINIDSFQEINDLYGNKAGDTILKDFAFYLKELIPNTNSLFRLHSDEFAYLCSDSIDINDFRLLASFLNEKISQKNFKIDGKNELNISATFGISYGSRSLLENADIALKLAKKNKKNFLIYNDSMQMEKEYEKNLDWTKRLKKAINEDKIVPLFQPIVDNKTNKIVKYEALMRMIDTDGSYIAPIHFLELSKKNKLYHQLTKIMIEKTFKRFKNLPYSVSINVSVEDILNKDIYDFIIKKLRESKIGDRIVFEIIESEGIENFSEVFEFINDIKHYKAKISIDDFGTGYSNFDYLMKLKVDYIKIDGSMIKNIDCDENSKIITKTIVSFAKEMNIKIIAEFVHSKSVFDTVKELGVDFSQGYYFGAASDTIE